MACSLRLACVCLGVMSLVAWATAADLHHGLPAHLLQQASDGKSFSSLAFNHTVVIACNCLIHLSIHASQICPHKNESFSAVFSKDKYYISRTRHHRCSYLKHATLTLSLVRVGASRYWNADRRKHTSLRPMPPHNLTARVSCRRFSLEVWYHRLLEYTAMAVCKHAHKSVYFLDMDLTEQW